MPVDDLDHEAPGGPLTSALIRTILESRRALRMAISLTQELMREGALRQWEDEEMPTLARIPAVGLRHHHGTDRLRARARHSPIPRIPTRGGLRLVVQDVDQSS